MIFNARLPPLFMRRRPLFRASHIGRFRPAGAVAQPHCALAHCALAHCALALGAALLLFTAPNVALAQAEAAKTPAPTTAARKAPPVAPSPSSAAPGETPAAVSAEAPAADATKPVEVGAPTPSPDETSGAAASVPPPSASVAPSATLVPNASAPAAAPPTSAAAPAAPTPAAPRQPEPLRVPEAPLNARFDVAVVVQNVWNTAPAYDFFAEDNQLLQGGISLGFDAIELTPATVLSVDLGATTGETSHDGPLSSYIRRSTLRRTDLGVGVGVRHHIWYWLAPHVRVSGAAALERATVSSPDFEQLTVEETNFVGAVGGGFTFYSAAKRLSATRSSLNSLAFRLTAEAGYQFAGGIPFVVEATAPSNGIARAAIPLGDLPQSGPYLRFAAGAHF